MDDFGISKSQEFANELIAQGRSGMLVPSFALGAHAGDTNLVLWKWDEVPPHKLTLHDPTDRLGTLARRLASTPPA